MNTDPDEHAKDSAIRVTVSQEIDFTLLDDSLTQITWERMQANDDALQFAELLRAAVEKRNGRTLAN